MNEIYIYIDMRKLKRMDGWVRKRKGGRKAPIILTATSRSSEGFSQPLLPPPSPPMTGVLLQVRIRKR
jgi:hypothetical protein